MNRVNNTSSNDDNNMCNGQKINITNLFDTELFLKKWEQK
jgi:hypothetical protein